MPHAGNIPGAKAAAGSRSPKVSQKARNTSPERAIREETRMEAWSVLDEVERAAIIVVQQARRGKDALRLGNLREQEVAA
jgi:hypothetical protein